HELHHGREKPLCGAQTQMIDGFEDQSAFNGEIGIEKWRAWPCGRRGVAPRRNCVFVEPYGEAATVDQGAIVLMPVANAIVENISCFGHAPIVAVGVAEGNY